jgi:hypothetical protein
MIPEALALLLVGAAVALAFAGHGELLWRATGGRP